MANRPAGRRVRVFEKAASIDDVRLAVEAAPAPRPGPGECLIEVRAAAVNPSDAKATLGIMPMAVWPRTPGRDYAGVVVDGPGHLVGREVWGTGGDLGIRRDGTHATHLVVRSDQVREKPSTLSLEEAGSVGVPFVTAYGGLQMAGGVGKGDVVLVCGGNGKVGQAVAQIAAMQGARVFGAGRRREAFVGDASAPVEMIDASREDVAAHVRDRTGGHGADIVYNTVGSPYFEAANKAMAHEGRQIFIATLDRAVPFDIFAFYRGRHSYFGFDSLGLDTGECGEILEALRPGFESGKLKPFPVKPEAVYPLDDAPKAYRAALSGTRDRIVLRPMRPGG
jgi:NADPH:quinone reductase